MKITGYIAKLQTILEEHGDLEVETHNTYFGRIPAGNPEVDYRLVLKGRERIPRFFMSGSGIAHEERGSRKGEKVCRV